MGTHLGKPAGVWQSTFKSRWPGKGMVRWFAHNELCTYFFQTFNASKFEEFLNNLQEANATQSCLARLRKMYNEQWPTILIQFAIGVDLGTPLANACYYAERDGAHIHIIYALIENLRKQLDRVDGQHSNLDSIGRLLSSSNNNPNNANGGLANSDDSSKSNLDEDDVSDSNDDNNNNNNNNNRSNNSQFCRTKASVINEGLRYVRESKDYFLKHFYSQEGDYNADMALFKACEMLDPRCIVQLDFRSVKLYLNHFIWLSDDDKAALLDELVQYKSHCNNLPTRNNAKIEDDEFDIISYWKERYELPNWRRLAKDALAIQPTSASVERLFATLDRLFSSEQRSLLEDGRDVACKMSFDRVYEKRTIN